MIPSVREDDVSTSGKGPIFYWYRLLCVGWKFISVMMTVRDAYALL